MVTIACLPKLLLLQKYGVFSDFRRQYDAAAEEQAREKLRQMKRSPPPGITSLSSFYGN